MSERILIARRRLIRGAIAGLGVGALSGCDALSRKPGFIDVLSVAEPLNQSVQRFLTGDRLAQEFPASMISPVFRPNGSINPRTPEYLALKRDNFASYRLKVQGLVENPLELDLDAIRAMPARTQITRHDCVEGWSVIGQWTGVPLAQLLALAKPSPLATHVVFHCFDELSNSGARYYESIDLRDAYHPQTIVAHSLNGERLGVPNGAPLRMRIERKLGYKHAKYLAAIELRTGFAGIGGGRGGYWEDRGYDWYAGI
jgi:DMSO/TMAO reductase YedYZ molybdopterin-dependent catalytic subunit